MIRIAERYTAGGAGACQLGVFDTTATKPPGVAIYSLRALPWPGAAGSHERGLRLAGNRRRYGVSRNPLVHQGTRLITGASLGIGAIYADRLATSCRKAS